MSYGTKTGKQIVVVVATLLLIVAGTLIWSRAGSIEQQAAKAKAAEASATISPIEIMSKSGKDLPVEKSGADPF